MSEYKKKTSGVTSFLVRKAHGDNKIHHESWGNELNPIQEKDSKRKRKSSKKINPIFGNVYRTLGIAFILVFWVALLTGNLNNSIDSIKSIYTNKISPIVFKNKIANNPKPIQRSVKQTNKATSNTTPVSAAKPKPQPKYKYLLKLKSGYTVVADEAKLKGDKLKYTKKNMMVTIPRSQLISYQKIAVK